MQELRLHLPVLDGRIRNGLHLAVLWLRADVDRADTDAGFSEADVEDIRRAIDYLERLAR